MLLKTSELMAINIKDKTYITVVVHASMTRYVIPKVYMNATPDFL